MTGLGEFGRIVEALVRGVAIGQHDAMDALLAERIDRHHRADRRIDAAGEAEHDAGKAVLVDVVAQALHAGKPMIVMPYSHDQPDNARRVRRLGVAKVVQRKNFTAERAAKMIASLLSNPRYAERALEVQREMATEDGLKTACDALEKIMRR